MEIINPCIEDFRDVKLCRLCGSNNKENIDIFTSKPISQRSEDLLTKILTVYPLVLYKDDPLPQHICPKCIGNVSTTYQAIQLVMRQQHKWVNLTKAVQPEHKYLRILNAVENSAKATKETIRTSYNININGLPLQKILATTSTENHNNSTAVKATNNETFVKNIQNKLESNGFTIKRIKIPTSTNNINNEDLNAITDSADLSSSPIGEKISNNVTCNYCQQKFSDLKILAQHQLIHLKVSTNKIFQKYLLSKHLRRGRLITLNDNKCIRCLNCWRIYNDNKAILQHWSGGDCEFYCFICGKDFHHSPKMLREHVSKIHGINHRSVRNEFMTRQSQYMKPVSFAESTMKSTNNPMPINLNCSVIRKPSYKKPSPKSCTKNDDGTIACKICHKVFDNFRSSNSHMRKHKPPSHPRKPIRGSSFLLADKYNTQDYYDAQPSTSELVYGNTPTTSPLDVKYPRPAYQVVMRNGPLRGIKTKIVQSRQDYLNECAINGRRPAQSSDINDDENLIVPELLTSAMNPEHMNSAIDGLEYGEYNGNLLTQTIKSEPLDNSEYIETQEPRVCFVCNESFSNTRDYELHAMFVHNIN